MQSSLSIEAQVSSASASSEYTVQLTVIYEDRPSATITGNSPESDTDAELEVFRQARDQRLLEGAKMLLVRRGQTTHAEYFSHSKAYRRFLNYAGS